MRFRVWEADGEAPRRGAGGSIATMQAIAARCASSASTSATRPGVERRAPDPRHRRRVPCISSGAARFRRARHRPRAARLVVRAEDGSSLGPSTSRGGGDDPLGFDAFDRTMADFYRQNQRMMRDLDDSFRSADSLSRRMEEEASTGAFGTPRTYRREERSEKQLPGGGYSKYYYSESVTTFGGPVNGASLGLNPFAGGSLWGALALAAAVAAYVRYTKRFLAGFERTTYRAGARALMAIAWPALWLMNTRGFRPEFATAVRDADGDPTAATRGQPGAATDSGSIETNLEEADEELGDGDGDGPGART